MRIQIIPDTIVIEHSEHIKNCAKKDLETIQKLHEAVKIAESFGIIIVSMERGDFFQFFNDCEEQLKRMIDNPLRELKGMNNEDYEEYDENGSDWEVSNYYALYSNIYENSDFDLVSLWPKVMPNTIKALESLGIKVGWTTPGWSGNFQE